MLEFIMCSFVGKKAVRFHFSQHNTGIKKKKNFIMRHQHTVYFLFSTDWNQGSLIAVACSSMLGCFTSSYRRDLSKVNWHIVRYFTAYCI